jgi:hypothetical protein
MRASLRDSLRGEARTLAGLVAAGLIVGAAAVTVLRAAGDVAEPGAAEAKIRVGSSLKKAVGRQVTKAIAARATAGGAAATSAAVPGAQASATPAGAGTRAVPAATSQRLTVNPTAPKPAASAAVAFTDPGPQYRYNAIGRRDPFLPLVGGSFVDIDAPPETGGLKVVGVVWGSDDRFALVEDSRGNSFVLREGDKVMNGVVQGLRRDALILSLTADGQSQTVTIPLTRKGDSDANR